MQSVSDVRCECRAILAKFSLSGSRLHAECTVESRATVGFVCWKCGMDFEMSLAASAACHIIARCYAV